jgi:uncharacterized membrane protein YeiH
VIAFAGGWVVVLINLAGFEPFVAVALGAIFTIVLRVMALLFGWRLPTWKV